MSLIMTRDNSKWLHDIWEQLIPLHNCICLSNEKKKNVYVYISSSLAGTINLTAFTARLA